jgi:RHS repeat-associated protein
VFRRIADGTETSVVLTYSQALAKSVVAAIYRNTDQDFPIDVVASPATNASGTALNLNSVNARRANDLLVGIPAATGNVLAGSWSFSGGLTSRVQDAGNPLSNIALADQPLTSTGLTGTRGSSTTQSGQLIGISLTLSPRPDVLYFHHDQQGSTRFLTDQFARVRATYNYDPYGRTVLATGTYGTPLRYTGEYTDSESGFSYLRARYYDPTTAQFLTRDPLGAITRSAYSYVYGDPLNAIDPSGLDCGWTDPIGCASDAASAVGGAVHTAANGVVDATNAALPVVHAVANGVALVASACAVVTSETIVGGVTCGAVALGAGGVSAATGGILYAEGRESGVGLTLDVGGLGLSGVGSLAELGAAAAEGIRGAAGNASFLGRASYELWDATANGLVFVSRALSVEGFGFGLYGSLCKP